MITAREREVVKLIASGKSRKEVADCLGVSVKTASTHLMHIYRKIGVGSSVELVWWAIANHLFDEKIRELLHLPAPEPVQLGMTFPPQRIAPEVRRAQRTELRSVVRSVTDGLTALLREGMSYAAAMEKMLDPDAIETVLTNVRRGASTAVISKPKPAQSERHAPELCENEG